MSPFKIALNLGQRVHTTRGRPLRGRWGLVPLSKKKCFSIALGHTLVVLEMH